MKLLTLLLAFSAFFLGTGQSIATPINITATRQVLVGDLATGNFSGAASPSAAQAAFTDAINHTFSYPAAGKTVNAQANQTSNINAGTGLFSGTGGVGVAYNALQGEGSFANSFFDVAFDLTTAHNYTLTGMLNANADGGHAETYFQLFGASINPIISFDAIRSDHFFEPSANLTSSGTLTAGSYHLLVSAIFNNCVDSRASTGQNNPCGPVPGSYMGTSPQFTNFDFNFQLAEVPEPSTLALFGIALAGLGFTRQLQQGSTSKRQAIYSGN